MRVPQVFSLLATDAKTFASSVSKRFTDIVSALNGALTFGDGTSSDNISGVWAAYTTNGTANTEDAIAHNMGVIPVGVLVMLPPGNGFLYRGASAWTTTNIYLKCSQASQAVSIFILAPPRT